MSNGIPLGHTHGSKLPSQAPQTAMIPEETELITDETETTHLLKTHHEKYDGKYGDQNGHVTVTVDGYVVIDE